MQLGIFKITYNRTAQPRCYHNAFYGDSFVNLGEEVILTLLWQSGTSESATVCFVISLSICYWLLKCRVFASCVCVCVWERERERERERVTAQRRVCVRVCVCVCGGGGVFWKLKLAIMERGVTFPARLMVFGQSQCTVPVGQSEQTALIGRRDFVINKVFERGGA